MSDQRQWTRRSLKGPKGDPGPAGSGGGGVTDHTLLTNIGTNTHAAIDTHIAAANPHSGSQPSDPDLSAIAALTATTDNVIQSVASTWSSRTPAQVKATLVLVKGDVGLANVDNTADMNKPVSTAQAAADAAVAAAAQPLDLDLTVIGAIAPNDDDVMQRKAGAWSNRTPAQLKTDLALVKGDVGLANVDNTADANKPVSTAQQAAIDGRIPYTLYDAKGDLLVGTGADTGARLAVGADGTYLKADSAQATGLTWATIAGGGDVSGPAASVDSEAVLFSGTTGKVLKRSALTGLIKQTAGVQSVAVAGTDYQAADQDLTDIATIAGVQGDLMVRDATKWARLAKGASMQRLRMNVGATDPEWADDLDLVGRFRLAANGGAIGPAIANFFGTNSAFSTAASTHYRVVADCYFTKTTAGTVVWTLTSSTAYTSAAIGMVAPGVLTGNADTLTAAAAVATLASGSLTTAVKHYMQIVAVIETNTAGNIRLNVTSSAGTVTPLRGSLYRVYRMPSGNTGSFVA